MDTRGLLKKVEKPQGEQFLKCQDTVVYHLAIYMFDFGIEPQISGKKTQSKPF